MKARSRSKHMAGAILASTRSWDVALSRRWVFGQALAAVPRCRFAAGPALLTAHIPSDARFCAAVTAGHPRHPAVASVRMSACFKQLTPRERMPTRRPQPFELIEPSVSFA